MISTLRETDDADETTQLVSDCANLLNDAAPATTEAALDVRQELREELLGSLLGAADGSALGCLRARYGCGREQPGEAEVSGGGAAGSGES